MKERRKGRGKEGGREGGKEKKEGGKGGENTFWKTIFPCFSLSHRGLFEVSEISQVNPTGFPYGL